MSITPESTGFFEVRTAAGTQLILELTADERFVTRKPGMFRPDGAEEPVRLAGDFTRLPLTAPIAVTAGEPVAYTTVAGDEPVAVKTAAVTVIEQL